MPRITISIPDDVLKKFKESSPETNVAALARRVIVRKLEELESAEKSSFNKEAP